MRYPKTHKFLKKAATTALMSIGGCLPLLFGAAQIWQGVKSWAEAQFIRLEQTASTPWFFISITAFFIIYILALLWTGSAGRKQGVLYLYLPDDPERICPSDYITAWSPKPFWQFPFSNYHDWSPVTGPPHRKADRVAFDLHNPGPTDVFHVHVMWELKGKNPLNEIMQSRLFQTATIEVTKGDLEISTEHGGIARSVRMRDEYTVPKIAAGNTIRILLPQNLNFALALRMVIEAEKISDKPIQSVEGISSFFKAMRRDSVPMPLIKISLNYRNSDEQKFNQKFGVGGIIRGRIALLRKQEHEENTLETDPVGVASLLTSMAISPI